MNIKDIAQKLNMKIIDEDENWIIFKIASNMHIFYLQSKNNQFIVERDLFEYLDSNKLPYSFLLYDSTSRKYYFLDLARKNNWVKSCFDTCNKDEIFLGKQVLNNGVNLEWFINYIKKIS